MIHPCPQGAVGKKKRDRDFGRRRFQPGIAEQGQTVHRDEDERGDGRCRWIALRPGLRTSLLATVNARAAERVTSPSATSPEARLANHQACVPRLVSVYRLPASATTRAW